MPAILGSPAPVTFRPASWAFYHAVREEMSNGTKVIFYKGQLEVMSPVSIDHEGDKSLIARLLLSYCETKGISIDAAGGLTLKRETLCVALEPDESYYLRTQPPPRDAGVLDLSVYPPPDLAIEIEHSRSAIDKELIYQELGVAEVWRWDGTTLRIRSLRPDRDGYDASHTSKLLPSLPVQKLVDHLRSPKTTRQSEIVRSWMSVIEAPG